MIDEISLKILKILQQRARIPNAEVARQVNMAPSAVLERIRKLEKQGIIQGYEVRLNPAKFRRNLVAFMKIDTETNVNGTHVGTMLSRIPEIQEVHHIAGEDGFLIKVRVSDPTELGRLILERIQPLSFVRATRTAIAMATYKETARIPIDDTDSDKEVNHDQN
ncbi:MAG: Lrp/AsnC family transcriptional regulator [Deltaproteobacteria bacterium]|jgi:Lrp/AsnC family leucine-responsive transcriptional regulator